jgi:dihydropyrimidine dehydrogenase (NAD+) subunit PreA
MEEAPCAESVDLSCEICGVPLEKPFLLSSSVVASNYEMCARAFEIGWAGVAYKTICLMDIHETSPRFSAMKGRDGVFYGFKNIEQLSPPQTGGRFGGLYPPEAELPQQSIGGVHNGTG